MTSIAQRRRRKRAKITLPGGEQIDQKPTGRDRTHTNQAEDARKTALQARTRVFGAPATQDAKKASGDPLWGCSVGRMLLAEPDTHRADLWNAAQHARKTQLAYDRAIGAPSRHAQCLRILLPLAAMEADASSPAPDFRTEEDRNRQAVSAQMRLEGWIGHTDNRAVSAFKQSVINDPDGPIRDWHGVINCLWSIVEGLAGQKVQARVRK